MLRPSAGGRHYNESNADSNRKPISFNGPSRFLLLAAVPGIRRWTQMAERTTRLMRQSAPAWVTPKSSIIPGPSALIKSLIPNFRGGLPLGYGRPFGLPSAASADPRAGCSMHGFFNSPPGPATVAMNFPNHGDAEGRWQGAEATWTYSHTRIWITGAHTHRHRPFGAPALPKQFFRNWLRGGPGAISPRSSKNLFGPIGPEQNVLPWTGQYRS